ncbi:MAG: EexN family lipoprotein [Pseudomonadota bacterium]
MRQRKLTIRIHRGLIPGFCMVLAACGPAETQVRTVTDFLGDTVAMDAKILECRKDRKMAVRDPECKAARQAAARLSAAQEEARRDAREKASEAELNRLRRQQEARDEADERRRAQLVASAESKIESGQALTPEEARAIGIDPDSSVLVESDNDR